MPGVPEQPKAVMTPKPEFVVPYVLRLKLVQLAWEEERDLVLTMLGKTLTEDSVTIRSKSFEEQVTFNLGIDVKIEEAGILRPTTASKYWCEECVQGDFWSCSYRTATSKLSCAEYEMAHEAAAETSAVKSWSIGFGTQQDANPSYTPMATTPTNSDAAKVKALTKAQPKSTLPYGLLIRCPECWHWFEGESKLADHAKWACPAKENDGEQFYIIPCSERCCENVSTMLDVYKPGYGDDDIPVADDAETNS